MALFGKKGKDGASDAGADAGFVAGIDEGANNGGVALADAPPVKAGRAPKVPKAAKGKTLKNGVAVGLNIGNQFIKAVEVTSRNGELSVTAMGAVPTPAESYTNGNVLSVSALSGAIKELWRGAGIKSKVTVASVAGTGALVVRVIEVPRMSDGELGDNMKVDADRYIPFPPSEVVMDFKALRELPTDPDAPNMEVLLAAAQREIIDLHVQVVQKAKLDPRAIDVEPIAAARAMQLERPSGTFIDYNEITAIVNLGATGTEISILRGDILVFTRVVPGGGNLITQAIADDLGLPFADAERRKIESADAQAPAGYGSGAGSGFGVGNDGDDFNFGGEEFGAGNDLNTAFDDISANPTAAASDDPFDLDFFNQGPKDEPGAGHAQKEGEPGEETPAFNFSGFDFEAPAAGETSAPSQPENQTEATLASSGFNFGFDDFGSDDLAADPPSEAVGPSSATDKRTAQLDDSATGVPLATPSPTNSTADNPAVASNKGILGGDFSMPSAFDFDNFDLPAAAPANVSSAPTPIETTPEVAPTNLNFGEVSPIPPSSGDTPPASFDFENGGNTSNSAAELAAPNATPAAAVPFDFALSQPSVTPIEATTVEEAPFAETTEETGASTSNAAPAATGADEFDLDAIFGTAPVASTVVPADALPTSDFAQEMPPQPLPEASLAGEPAVPMAAPVPDAVNSDDFDLSGTGAGDDFASGFDESDDFNTFGAGLVTGADNAEAATLYGLVYPSLEELASEVRRSLEFHLGRYPDATISRIVLVGGGARLRNVDVFLTQSLGVPTTIANPFSHVTVQTPKLAPGYATENGPLCAVALGLALRDFVD